MSNRAKTMVLLLVGLVGLVGASCAKSEEEIQEEFDAIVAESNACNDVSECVYAEPGCPLQCSVAVNSAKKAYVEKEARALIEETDGSARTCLDGCADPGPLACTEGRCQEGASP
ncbi:hypothetical protein [Sorangium sp. So ce1151]|uniref:hypothetical protein n=1 Tax=Sorangium sp. So ce1151 TaxID=3133332 RepID=UPI003F62EFA2